jgi:hypothetical protein
MLEKEHPRATARTHQALPGRRPPGQVLLRKRAPVEDGRLACGDGGDVPAHPAR